MSSMNGGFPNGERASLLSGLRTSGPRLSAHQQQQQQQMQQYQQQQQLYLQQQQQQQFYNAAAAAQNNPAQAQLFAFQQSQIELQLQQIQMANLALQDQILRQQQQAMQQQVQQAQQPQRQPSPPYASNTTRSMQRSASASPVVEQNKTVWTGNEHDAAARQERWGALRNLQQARKQREGSPSVAVAQTTAPSSASSTNNNDWQAERLRYAAAAKASDQSSGPATPVASPPLVTKATASIVSALEDLAKQSTQGAGGHSKTASTASSASIQSLSILEAGSQFSPNRGPALVLSSPGDEFEDEDDFPHHGGKEEPMSPSLSASMRAVNIHGRMAEAAKKDKEDDAKKEDSEKSAEKKKKRHTLILSSSLPAFAAKTSETSSVAGDSASEDSSASSAGSSSPTTSDRSEVASFESTATNATSAPATSPTSATHAEKEQEKATAVPSSSKTMNAKAAVFNPNAASFSPASVSSISGETASSGTSTPGAANSAGPRYPVALSLRSQSSTPVATPPPSMRLVTAPASVGSSYSGTPNGAAGSNNAITVLRQPKGPVDESELGSKNFAGMIRRKAVGALRVATYSGGRISPQSSPVVGGFPGDVQSFGGNQNYGSPQLGGMQSPTLPSGGGGFAAFGADLAQRAMKRRSQQMQLNGINPGLGMY